MATQFTVFGRLPPELRILIWELCIPSRVVELNRPVWPDMEVSCDLVWASRHNVLRPTIAYVCIEARQVAEQRVIHFGLEDLNQERRRGPFYFRPYRDLVVLYNTPGAPLNEWRQNRDHPFSSFRLVDQWAVDVAIYSPMVNPWPRCTDFGLRHGARFAPRTEWIDPLFVLQVIPIHLSKTDAIKSRLFGDFGDEPIQLVDPLDSERLARFRELVGNARRPQAQVAFDFFTQYTGTGGKTNTLIASVHAWTRDGLSREIWRAWKQAQEVDFEGISRPENIWLGPSEDFDMLDEDTFRGLSDAPLGGIDLTLFGPNEMHPWVQELLVTLPSFTPRIMFRWCGGQCWEGSGEDVILPV
ncbi:hypothetical protein N7462_000726 [Penicillium macrosclerotiorum]|uniref:uncharacterized protein n=1 Tax=Penicillium macrosclerotiorum TaxID=303699 RepID=UPI0025485F72|nr:uncharacterized protein N7462_000726 [Penicillium macrosclerotiorum]KAJ5698721.1 hypothetical protein N7462_000726 [Penicillium macrosclerotiorum]